ncbi:ABC transporter substrate-binding protein [Puniceibacterium sediminis]|uniref:Peptide/nickel transport system substrate-binding protein n=1 Tax=Puniceibacterium sediminis TaxID=1608407 RepID=A0A238YH23_9RHOB|nr:ABC transporter substrate-binding protein [Puniceibacterium sediminis]SNR69924.1 peptide/nickel transport system substrate-binding protein [Puniceibacterium sediminis]
MPALPTRRTFNKTIIALGLTVALPVAAIAQDPSLSIGMSTTPTTLDPHEDSSSPNNATSRHIFDSLINRGGAAENQPQLATEWKVVDDTHWEFTLRDGVKFHDGSDFDAEDVIASLMRARDKPSQGFASYTRNIANVTAPDPLHVIVETTVPDPMILNSLSRLRIISSDHVGDDVQAFDDGTAAIGTGPFKYASFVPGDRLELVRNDDYFGGAAEWSAVTLRFVPDNGARLASLLSGDLDLIETLPAEGIDRIEKSDNLKAIRGQSTRIVYLGMDVARDESPFVAAKDGAPLGSNPFKDANVRKAMLMSMNRPAIVDRVMQKNGTVADQFVAEGYFGHSDAVEKVAYDPEGAKKLLADAGYPDGFKLTLHGPSGRYVNDSDVLQAAGQMLTRIGIDTSVEVMPWSMYSDKYSDGAYSVFLGSWGVNTGEVSNPAVSLIETRDNDKGTGRYNGGGISDTEIDALLDEATATLDEASREPLLKQASEKIFNRTWILPIHYENVVIGAKNSIAFSPRGDKYTLAYEVKSAD